MKKEVRGSKYIKNKYYYVRIYYYIDGKRKSKDYATGIPVAADTKSFEKNKAKAEREVGRLVSNFVIPTHNPKADMQDQLLVDTARAWLDHQRGTKAPSTIASYQYQVNDIIKYFERELSGIRTVDLTAAQVERYLQWERLHRQADYNGEDKRRSKYADNRGVENTVLHRATALRSILQYAKREGIVDRNVASKRDSHIEFPRPQRHTFNVLDEGEAQALLDAIKDEPLWFQAAVILGLLYGMRRSEVIALRETDIDWQNNILQVSNTITQQTINGKNVLTLRPFTKNRNPKVFALTSLVRKILQDVIIENRKNKEQLGTAYDTEWAGFLCCYADGKLIAPNTLTRKFNEFIKKNGFKEIRYHDLRHSCASILYARGVDLLTLQEILGHTELTTTIAYTHKLSDRKTKALEDWSNQIYKEGNGEI